MIVERFLPDLSALDLPFDAVSTSNRVDLWVVYDAEFELFHNGRSPLPPPLGALSEGFADSVSATKSLSASANSRRAGRRHRKSHHSHDRVVRQRRMFPAGTHVTHGTLKCSC